MRNTAIRAAGRGRAVSARCGLGVLALVLTGVGLGCGGAGSTTAAPNRPAARRAAAPAPRARTTPSTTTSVPAPVMGRPVPSGHAATLTSATDQHYAYSGDGSSVTATMGTEATDRNIREVFWPPGTSFAADQQVCATWWDPALSPDRPHPQPGIALRVHPVGSGPNGVGTGLRAITVNQNVFAGAVWTVWVNLWDTSRSDRPFPVAKANLFDIVAVDDHTMLQPWRVCARARGTTVTFKVWTGDREPSWRDGDHVRTAELPADWKVPGYAGGYVAHLHPGGSARFSDLSVRPLR